MEPLVPTTRRMLDAFEGRRPDRVPLFNQAVHHAIVSDVLGRACWSAGGETRWASLKASMSGPDGYAQFYSQHCRDTVEFALGVGEDCVRVNWLMHAPPNAEWSGPDEVRWHSDDGARFGRFRFDADSGTVHEFPDWLDEPDGTDRLIAWLGGEEAAYSGPRPRRPEQVADLAELSCVAGGRLALAYSTGSLGVPMYVPAWLTAFALEPELVGRFIAREADQAIADLPAVRVRGVRALNAGLDLCYNNGPAYSPRLFREHVLPHLKRVTAAAHELGMFYIYRTDGNTWPIGQMLFSESGADAAGEIDYQAGMRLAEMRKAYPNLTLVGNVDCGVLAGGSEADVRRLTRECLSATGGLRHVMSSSNMVMKGTTTKNYLAMLEETRKFQ